jgi:hypothetical protein
MPSLDWPTGFERTDDADREPNNRIKVSLAQAFDGVEQELARLGVDEGSYRYDFDAPQRKTDQRPYSRANPDDPGFVLRWKMDAANYAVACDAYSRLRDNVRAIGLYLREKRKMEQRPVETGESEFANARLPPAGEDQAVVAAEAATPAHQILGVDPDASDEEVQEAARERLLEAHPDHGGSAAELAEIRNAREAMLDE